MASAASSAELRSYPLTEPFPPLTINCLSLHNVYRCREVSVFPVQLRFQTPVPAPSVAPSRHAGSEMKDREP
jgi:hypothetical protein